ncbi:hypothetical protein BS47DRAFT_1400571 [Hydnum rufescens UP504]|uniref:Uncharacterized protein n=1 Tax=Hydnum rufescens UP504 TaxID=1448309 RepID=A0A9P6AGF1_9AGAM|nr:hypothetical protein BS47DRAFT_1400571 [Hydnum rufescens UP504]
MTAGAALSYTFPGVKTTSAAFESPSFAGHVADFNAVAITTIDLVYIFGDEITTKNSSTPFLPTSRNGESNYILEIRKPRTTSNYRAHRRAHTNVSFPETGNGGSSENDTSVSSGGRGGDVLLSHSSTNNVWNVYHIYGHNVRLPIADAPLGLGIHIFYRHGVLELRSASKIEFVARLLFPFVIRIRHHGYDHARHGSSGGS